MIEVAPLGASEERAWDEFLLGSSGGLLYQSIAYRDLLVEHLGCEAEYLVAREDRKIRGLLPLMWAADPEGEGRIANSLPFYGSHGGVIADGDDAERALTDAWNERATGAGTLAATMVANPFLERRPPEPAHGMTDERIGQVTPLPGADPDELMAIYTKNGRRDVRRAERRGVTVERDPDRLDEVGRLHAENIRSIGGIPKSEKFFNAIPRHFEAGEGYEVWIGSLGGEMVAGLLVLYFGAVAEYFTPAVDPEHRADEPMARILLEAMSDAVRRGCREWNWGGTWRVQDGVYRFKRKWGAQERRYRYFVQVNDASLLDETPERLLTRFPHFYVAPFAELRSSRVAEVGEGS